MNPKSVFITGANRGLGLEFVKQFLKLAEPPKYIFAACRSPDKAEVCFKALLYFPPASVIKVIELVPSVYLHLPKGSL